MLWPWEQVTNQLDIQEKKLTCSEHIHKYPTEDIAVSASIFYQILPEGARLVMTEGQNWEQTLQQRFEELIGEVAADLSLKEVRAWERAASTRSVNSLSDYTDWRNDT